jgi:hypothetical protein
MDRGLGGPQSPSGRCGVKKISCPGLESNTGRSARRYTDWAIPVNNDM